MHHITKIEHPNLNHVVDFGHVGDHIYFIAEFFDGATLSKFRFTKTKVEALYQIIVQICYALNALHTQNILHRDLKPENILYKTNGKSIEVKLIDYGFSRLELDKDTQFVSGTLPYIAPEIYMGKEAGNYSDFYSLGVIIYRILTGSYPFTMDQITALRSGSHQYFIPIFPSELNPNIPLPLEKLCLRLLERNPENRFQSSEEIINYINRTSGYEHPFSVSWSLVNSMQFNSYTVQEKVVEGLLDYLPQVEQSNGKIISLVGGEGIGKESISSLFRYNILRGSYFIFDYTCTRTEHEAFFALIKEYLQSLTPEDIQSDKSLTRISEKMRRYLFMSEQSAKGLTPSQDDLRADFEFIKALLIDLSATKPVIFIVRNIQHLHRNTIDFINYVSESVTKNRILILMSSTDFNKVNQVEHTILINVPMFNPPESSAYIRKLLDPKTPDRFCAEIHSRSAGNPYFIREILIDLTLRKLVTYDGEFHYPESLAGYTMPGRLIHSVYSRMSHLTDQNYKHLQKLAIVQTPISREMIRYICKVKDNDLYNLLNDGKYNEILRKSGNTFQFTYSEAKERFFNECEPKLQKLVSLRVLKYFDTKKVNDPVTCRGIISNARIADDKVSERRYLLELYNLLREDYKQADAFDAIARALQYDLELLHEIPAGELVRDLMSFLGMLEITGAFEKAGFLWDKQADIPQLYEKYLVLGTLKLLAKDYKNALKHFVKAEKLAEGNEQKATALLKQSRALSYLDMDRLKASLDRLLDIPLSLSQTIELTDLAAIHQAGAGDPDDAIRTLEGFLEHLPPDQDPGIIIRLAGLHNNLGELYSAQKNVMESDEHLNAALNIWNRYNITRHLGWLHNNIADLYLKQGLTVLGEKHASLALDHAVAINDHLSQGRALLNQGEARIKMGEFEAAEIKLFAAREIIVSLKAGKYLDSIVRNLALAKSKIIGFGHYYKFIIEHEPSLINGVIPEINPLVKTYFYYLSEMSNPKKLRRMIRKNAHIDFNQIHEQEFYHNILSLLAISEHDYQTALKELKLAMQYAGEINNHYAMAVFNVLQVTCYYGLKDYAKAAELLNYARPDIQENQYRYWDQYLDLLELKLAMADPVIPLRQILRKINTQIEACASYRYYQLHEELWQMKVQVLLELNATAVAEKEFAAYRQYLERITADISDDDRLNFLNVNLYNLKNLSSFSVAPIASRQRNNRSRWNDLLFNIANVNSVQRVKFLIEKGITQIISPWQFRLMVFSEKIGTFYTFHSNNCDEDKLLPVEYAQYTERSFETDSLVHFKHDGRNVLIVPLLSGSRRIGYLALNDDGELDYTPAEIAIARNIKTHLAALIIRTWDYMEITLRMEKMNQLMNISHELMGILDMAELEVAIVSTAIDLTNSTRGFMIKRDADGNNLYQVQMDQDKQLLNSAFGISKTALSLCQANQETVSAYNAELDNRFRNAVSVQDYAIQTIFCCPIRVDDTVMGYLYLDNFGESTRELYLNEDIIVLFMNQIAIAIRNAQQYSSLMQKSTELNSLEQIKDEFMEIVSHELNTPLTALQGYISRLKRNFYADEEERQILMSKLEAAVNKLNVSVGDITTMNRYNLAKTLPMTPLKIDEILDLVHQEVEIISRQRKMQMRVEIEKGLPVVEANWEALHRMIYNIVLNSVRFTREFGTIVIGARRSSFPQEKIDNKETLVIYVRDNGIGIPEHQVKDVYRKFYELNDIYAHKSGTVEYRSSGLGLGLAISRRIAELHGGQIVIKSKQNEGTSVFVIIPFK
jgi:signal transduction histidine kinase/serine/threonine protein kinase